jgi:hypothetical protein
MVVAILPLAFVLLAAICIVQVALAMSFAVFDLAFVLLAIFIVYDAIIRHL